MDQEGWISVVDSKIGKGRRQPLRYRYNARTLEIVWEEDTITERGDVIEEEFVNETGFPVMVKTRIKRGDNDAALVSGLADGRTQQRYFYNPFTGDVVWGEPTPKQLERARELQETERKAKDAWVTMTDPVTLRTYEYNRITCQSRWTSSSPESPTDGTNATNILPKQKEQLIAESSKRTFTKILIPSRASSTNRAYVYDRSRLVSTDVGSDNDEDDESLSADVLRLDIPEAMIREEDQIHEILTENDADEDADAETETEYEDDEVQNATDAPETINVSFLLDALIPIRMIYQIEPLFSEWPSIETIEDVFRHPNRNWKLLMTLHQVVLLEKPHFTMWRASLETDPIRLVRTRWLRYLHRLITEWGPRGGPVDEIRRNFHDDLVKFIQAENAPSTPNDVCPFRPSGGQLGKEDPRPLYIGLSAEMRVRIFLSCTTWALHKETHFVRLAMRHEMSYLARPETLGISSSGTYFWFRQLCPYRIFVDTKRRDLLQLSSTPEQLRECIRVILELEKDNERIIRSLRTVFYTTIPHLAPLQFSVAPSQHHQQDAATITTQQQPPVKVTDASFNVNHVQTSSLISSAVPQEGITPPKEVIPSATAALTSSSNDVSQQQRVIQPWMIPSPPKQPRREFTAPAAAAAGYYQQSTNNVVPYSRNTQYYMPQPTMPAYPANMQYAGHSMVPSNVKPVTRLSSPQHHQVWNPQQVYQQQQQQNHRLQQAQQEAQQQQQNHQLWQAQQQAHQQQQQLNHHHHYSRFQPVSSSRPQRLDSSTWHLDSYSNRMNAGSQVTPVAFQAIQRDPMEPYGSRPSSSQKQQEETVQEEAGRMMSPEETDDSPSPPSLDSKDHDSPRLIPETDGKTNLDDAVKPNAFVDPRMELGSVSAPQNEEDVETTNPREAEKATPPKTEPANERALLLVETDEKQAQTILKEAEVANVVKEQSSGEEEMRSTSPFKFAPAQKQEETPVSTSSSSASSALLAAATTTSRKTNNKDEEEAAAMEEQMVASFLAENAQETPQYGSTADETQSSGFVQMIKFPWSTTTTATTAEGMTMSSPVSSGQTAIPNGGQFDSVVKAANSPVAIVSPGSPLAASYTVPRATRSTPFAVRTAGALTRSPGEARTINSPPRSSLQEVLVGPYASSQELHEEQEDVQDEQRDSSAGSRPSQSAPLFVAPSSIVKRVIMHSGVLDSLSSSDEDHQLVIHSGLLEDDQQQHRLGGDVNGLVGNGVMTDKMEASASDDNGTNKPGKTESEEPPTVTIATRAATFAAPVTQAPEEQEGRMAADSIMAVPTDESNKRQRMVPSYDDDEDLDVVDPQADLAADEAQPPTTITTTTTTTTTTMSSKSLIDDWKELPILTQAQQL